MNVKTQEPLLKTEESIETLGTWINRSYIGSDLRVQLSKANALLVPIEKHVDQTKLVAFPPGTVEIFEFLRESQRDGVSFDICAEDEDYKELALHVDILVIASAIVTAVVAPVVTDLIAEYIKQRLGKRGTGAVVKSELTVNDEKTGRSIRFLYEGPADSYRDIMGKAIRERDWSQSLPTTVPKDIKPLPAPEKRKKKRRKK